MRPCKEYPVHKNTAGPRAVVHFDEAKEGKGRKSEMQFTDTKKREKGAGWCK